MLFHFIYTKKMFSISFYSIESTNLCVNALHIMMWFYQSSPAYDISDNFRFIAPFFKITDITIFSFYLINPTVSILNFFCTISFNLVENCFVSLGCYINPMFFNTIVYVPHLTPYIMLFTSNIRLFL